MEITVKDRDGGPAGDILGVCHLDVQVFRTGFKGTLPLRSGIGKRGTTLAGELTLDISWMDAADAVCTRVSRPLSLGRRTWASDLPNRPEPTTDPDTRSDRGRR